jgi:hypothetical protein
MLNKGRRKAAFVFDVVFVVPSHARQKPSQQTKSQPQS